MTKLTTKVRRESANTYEQGRPIIVILEPGDTIAFRQKGRQYVWRTTIKACLWLAVQTESRAAAAEKKLKRQRGRTC